MRRDHRLEFEPFNIVKGKVFGAQIGLLVDRRPGIDRDPVGLVCINVGLCDVDIVTRSLFQSIGSKLVGPTPPLLLVMVSAGSCSSIPW